MKKVGLYNVTIKNELENYFSNKDVEFVALSNLDNTKDFNLVITYGCYNTNLNNSINIHPALLPSYSAADNPMLEAFNDGVKVSGITIHKGDKILAQYPVLISYDTHFDDFEQEMLTVEKKLLPVVVDCILNDKVFDFQDLFKSPCSTKGCRACGRCH